MGLRDLLYRPEEDGFEIDLPPGTKSWRDLLYRPERDVIQYETLRQAPRMPGLA